MTKASGSGSLEKVTVYLTPASSLALEDAAARMGDSKTDTINRAVQVYATLAATFAQSPARGDWLERVKRAASALGTEVDR